MGAAFVELREALQRRLGKNTVVALKQRFDKWNKIVPAGICSNDHGVALHAHQLRSPERSLAIERPKTSLIQLQPMLKGALSVEIRMLKGGENFRFHLSVPWTNHLANVASKEPITYSFAQFCRDGPTVLDR